MSEEVIQKYIQNMLKNQRDYIIQIIKKNMKNEKVIQLSGDYKKVLKDNGL